MTMGANTPVDITQSSGRLHRAPPQGLFRIDAGDADALGFEVPESARPRETGEPATEQEAWESLNRFTTRRFP